MSASTSSIALDSTLIKFGANLATGEASNARFSRTAGVGSNDAIVMNAAIHIMNHVPAMEAIAMAKMSQYSVQQLDQQQAAAPKTQNVAFGQDMQNKLAQLGF